MIAGQFSVLDVKLLRIEMTTLDLMNTSTMFGTAIQKEGILDAHLVPSRNVFRTAFSPGFLGVRLDRIPAVMRAVPVIIASSKSRGFYVIENLAPSIHPMSNMQIIGSERLTCHIRFID